MQAGRGIPDWGVGGHAPAPGVIQLTLDPARFSDTRMIRTLVHELHHLIRWDGPGYGNSLGAALVSEGLAGHFVTQVLGGPPDPWDATAATAGLTKRAVTEWAWPDYDHALWFFGSGNIRKWAGLWAGASSGWCVSGRTPRPDRRLAGDACGRGVAPHAVAAGGRGTRRSRSRITAIAGCRCRLGAATPVIHLCVFPSLPRNLCGAFSLCLARTCRSRRLPSRHDPFARSFRWPTSRPPQADRRNPAAKAGEAGTNSGPTDATFKKSVGNGGEPQEVTTDRDTGMTTDHGVPMGDNQNSLKAGARGPTLLEDFVLREKIFHFDHERIPERIVHARGSGAHGLNCTMTRRSRS